MPNDAVPVQTEFQDKQLSYPLDHNSAEILKKYVLDILYPQSRWKNVGRLYSIKVIDDATTLTTGDGKVIVPVPLELDNTQVIGAHAFLSTVSSSGAVTVQVRNVTDSVDVLSTAITIDQSEYDSYTAATPPVINFANGQLQKSDRIAIDVDGAGTGAKGLCVILSLQ